MVIVVMKMEKWRRYRYSDVDGTLKSENDVNGDDE